MSSASLWRGGALVIGLLTIPALCSCSASAPGAAPWAAATVVAAPVDLPDDAAAIALLRQSAAAAVSTSFEGVTATLTSDQPVAVQQTVVHIPGRGTLTAALDGSDGHLVPDGSVNAGFAGSVRYLDVLVSRYAVRVAGDGTVMGRPADEVQVQDSSARTVARFWVDRRTGLMVKRELIDTATGRTRTVEFVRLRTPARAMATAVVAATPAPSEGTTLDDVAVTRLRAEGWVCPEALPGGLSFVSADELTSGAVHMVYSDGLDVVSLFVQRGRLDPQSMPELAAQSRSGGTVLRPKDGTATWVWATQGSVLTMMTDAPNSTAEHIIEALPPDSL